MKVRNDFVTNSSSSSFIIARHKDCTIDEIKTMLNKNRDNILELINSFEGDLDCDYMDEIRSAYDSNETNLAIDLAIECLAMDLIHDGWNKMQLGDWNVTSAYGSNEDGQLFGSMLYDFGHDMDTEHVKIMRGD